MSKWSNEQLSPYLISKPELLFSGVTKFQKIYFWRKRIVIFGAPCVLVCSPFGLLDRCIETLLVSDEVLETCAKFRPIHINTFVNQIVWTVSLHQQAATNQLRSLAKVTWMLSFTELFWGDNIVIPIFVHLLDLNQAMVNNLWLFLCSLERTLVYNGCCFASLS